MRHLRRAADRLGNGRGCTPMAHLFLGWSESDSAESHTRWVDVVIVAVGYIPEVLCVAIPVISDVESRGIRRPVPSFLF